jgi:L-threonylcarbamoyladenylate synthase
VQKRENSLTFKTEPLIIDKANCMKQTLMMKVNPREPDIEKIRIAAKIIIEGGLVAFPTETVYGLGANALNSDAVLALFEAKDRPLDNPPIVHVKNVQDVCKLAEHVSSEAEKLMTKFWPGPLTLIFKRSSVVPAVTVAGLDTVAIRMPKHKVALMLIRESNCPIAAPSGNLSGRPSPTSAKHVFEDLNGRIDAILDGGPTRIGVESTVIDLTSDPPIVLRPGGIPFEALKKMLTNVRLHPSVISDRELSLNEARSPGMRHKHYAPNAEVIVVEGSILGVTAKVRELAESYKQKGAKVGILATDETKVAYEADVVKSLGSRYNMDAVAQNLFSLLRELDARRVSVIIAEGLSTDGLGLAVMNRLRKASGYNIIKAE